MSQGYEVEIRERVILTDDVFTLTGDRPQGFTFIAGQYVRVNAFSLEREYSVVSGEEEQNITFLVKAVEGGAMSSRLRTAALPLRLAIGRAQGYFHVHPGGGSRVFIATGTGVAPFVSMIRSGIRPDIFLQGAQRIEELYFRAEVQRACSHYQPCLSAGDDTGDIFHGHVTGYLEQKLPPGQYDFYLCGGWAMIRDVTHVIDAMFPDSVLYTEGFD